MTSHGLLRLITTIKDEGLKEDQIRKRLGQIRRELDVLENPFLWLEYAGLMFERSAYRTALHAIHKAVSFPDGNCYGTAAYILTNTIEHLVDIGGSPTICTSSSMINLADHAEKLYLKAISHDPSDKELYLGLAKVQAANGKFGACDLTLRSVLSQCNTDFHVLAHAARIYLEQHESRAAHFITRAIQYSQNPCHDDLEVLMETAILLGIPEITEEVRTLWSNYEGDMTPILFQAETHLELGNYKRAKALCDYILSIYPENKDATEILEEIHAKKS